MNSPNVFIRTEFAYLRRAARPLKHRPLQLLLIVSNVSLALMPFLATGQYADIPFHGMIGAVLACFCLGYELYAIVTAIDSIEHEKRNRAWDNLILTGVDARKIVFGKWQALLRYWRGTYLLYMVSRLALAYSVMQILNILPVWIDMDITNWNRAFVYMSYGGYASPTPIAYYPDLWQVVIAALLLAALSIAELGLVGALGFLSTAIRSDLPGIKVLSVLFSRLIVGGFGVMLLLGTGALEMEAYRAHTYLDYDVPSTYFGCDGDFARTQADYYAWCVDERHQRRVFETIQVSGATLADTGVLLAANVMRPIGMLQFALRNSVSAVISLALFDALTGVSLLAASKLIARQSST